MKAYKIKKYDQFAEHSPPYERKIAKGGEWKYVFFSNDPNELVGRLMIEQQAGNGNHINEIVEIVEVLKEYGIIE